MERSRLLFAEVGMKLNPYRAVGTKEAMARQLNPGRPLRKGGGERRMGKYLQTLKVGEDTQA